MRATLRPVWISMALSACALGCASTAEKKQAATYGSTESVVEIVAVLRRHVPDDTYRFPPATDFTGRNIYRASLIRLENVERMHADALRAGHMDAVMAFSKGRALERLRAYDLAAQQYQEAARFGGVLREEAERSAAVCDAIDAAVRHGIELVDPLSQADGGTQLPEDPDEVLAGLDERVNQLTEIAQNHQDSHYEVIVREEIERADMTRARYFVDMRFVLPDGQLRAVSELQRLVARHSASKNRRKNMLDLASFYSKLAHEYVDAHPPETLRFDPPRFQELVDGASHLYQAVATQDGTPEKLEAARELEAFLAFTLQVDRDRFAR